MIASATKRLLRLAPLAAIVLFGACGGGLREPSPADIPMLEQAVTANPEDQATRTQLGIAYFKDDRNEDAVRQLQTAVEGGSELAATYLYLGLANEEVQEWTAAREAYTQYLDLGRWDPLQERIERRLVHIVRQELQQQARSALAQESQLATQPPQPRSIAVFPFQLVSENQDLLPLQVALADMMITDLAISNALTVLERTQIQTLLDEMALAEGGYTDASTGARAGRLLQAEHVVQGALTTLGDDQLRFDASVRNTESGNEAGAPTAQDALEALFDMEKEIVFDVFDALGTQLTPAEREAINENRSESVLAFLAYGQGLMALDNGDYDGAQQFFAQAADIDPGFQAASARNQEAQDLSDAASTSTDDVAAQGGAEMGGTVTGVADATTAGNTQDVLTRTSQDVNPSRTTQVVDQGTTTDNGSTTQQTERDTRQEAAQSETTTRPKGTIVFVIRRPGSGGGR